MNNERNKLSIRQKMAIFSVKQMQKVMVRKGYRNMVKISDKYRAFIDEIQEKCADIIELEHDDKQQINIVATVCANIIQGFDNKEEMNLVIEMIQHAVNEYWNMEDIPQKENGK